MKPEIGKSPCVYCVDVKAAWKAVRIRTTFSSALHAALTSDRHNATFATAQHATRKSEIYDGSDVIDAKLMLGKTGTVDEHCGTCGAVQLRKGDHLITSDSRALLEHIPGLLGNGCFDFFETARVVGNESVIHLISGDKSFYDTIDEGDVAADAHLVEIIHQLARECARAY